MSAILSSFIAVSVVSFLPLALLAPLFRRRSLIFRYAPFFYSFATGAVLTNVFSHLFWESFPHGFEWSPLLTIVGVFLGLFGLDRVAHRRRKNQAENDQSDLWVFTVLGDSLHNLIDGSLITTAFVANPISGISVTFAVLMHEIPQELAEWGMMIKSGVGFRRSILLNLFSTLFAFGGVALVFWNNYDGESMAHFLAPITVANFLYLAFVRLVPEVFRKELRGGAVWGALAGIGLMSLTHFLPIGH